MIAWTLHGHFAQLRHMKRVHMMCVHLLCTVCLHLLIYAIAFYPPMLRAMQPALLYLHKIDSGLPQAAFRVLIGLCLILTFSMRFYYFDGEDMTEAVADEAVACRSWCVSLLRRASVRVCRRECVRSSEKSVLV